MTLNEFDLLVIIFLLIGVIYGAFRGAGRQIIGLFSAWLGLIVCLWLYIPFSRRILKGIFLKQENVESASNVVFDTFAFFMLLIVFSAIVQFIIVQTTKSPEEKTDQSGKTFIDRANQKNTISIVNLLGGLITGFVVTAVWVSILMAPVQHALFSMNTSSGFFIQLKSAMSTSFLVPYFKLVLGGIYASIQFFIPSSGGLPVIFRSFLG